MKRLLYSSFFLLIAHIDICAQEIIQIQDSLTRQPVADAHVYSATGLLVAISNQNGQVAVPPETPAPLLIYHSLYQKKRLNLNGKNIYLIPYTQEIQELKVSGLSNEQLMQKLLKISARQLDNNIYYGKARYIHTTLLVVPDSHTGVTDTITHNAVAEFYFTWELNKKRTKAKLKTFPYSGHHEAWSLRYKQKNKLNEKNLPPHAFIFNQDRLFDFLFVDRDRMIPKTKTRSSRKVGDSISTLSFTGIDLENKLESRKTNLSYTNADSVLLSFETVNRYANSDLQTADELYQITYGYFDNLYFMQTGRFEYHYKRGEYQFLQILELSHTPPSAFESYKAMELNDYLYTLKPDFIPIQPLILPITQ